ncbi:MAG TPA: formate/nitrite transporter family protein [Rhodopila sp.]|uniref:formate/nitrite transporter family protein n=1 Tax=Rhodopila sp. TaxID=2480087 RepID=UPI002BF5D44D|nr:formate/nitrite transporter family protein [Rhodopila sp.]HVY17140.1 formate/nitrite transporter family protein [Rhodopila sp.]
MAEAGEASPHLDRKERRQAAAGAPIGAIVIHEIVRDQGEEELERSTTGLALSALAAGLSIGFSFLVQAFIQAALPEAGWTHLVSGFGYSVGFLIVILGRQQLFTETTLTAMIPALTRPTRAMALGTVRVWAVVLIGNLAATWVFATIVALAHPFPDATEQAMRQIAGQVMTQPFGRTVLLGGFAGWLIGLMVWLLPGAGPSRPLIIILLTYVVAICQFPHIIAGSTEAAFAVWSGLAPGTDYLTRFLLPVLIGNSLGGTILAALLNHAPVVERLSEPGPDDRG